MPESLIILSAFGVLILTGLLFRVLARGSLVLEELLLICSGVLFSLITYHGVSLVSFPREVVISVSVALLSLAVFERSCALQMLKFDSVSSRSFRLSAWWVFLSFASVLFVSRVLFSFSWMFSAFLAVLLFGIDVEMLLKSLRGAPSLLGEILHFESVLNTLFVLIIPLLLLEGVTSLNASASFLFGKLFPLMSVLALSVGVGLLVGIVLANMVRLVFSHFDIPLLLAGSAIGAYFLSDVLGGNGILSVVVFGFFFGNVYIKKPLSLLRSERVLARALYALVFLFLGIVVGPFLFKDFSVIVVVLFFVLALCRSFALHWSGVASSTDAVLLSGFSLRGVETAGIVLMLSVLNFGGVLSSGEVSLLSGTILLLMIFSSIGSLFNRALFKNSARILLSREHSRSEVIQRGGRHGSRTS